MSEVDNSQSAVRTHTVVPRDSLRLIALQYYGPGHQGDWKLLYEANRSVIGDNPYLLTPGTRLEIPLIQGALEATLTDETRRRPALKSAGCIATILVPITVLAFNMWKRFRLFGNWQPFPFSNSPSYPGEIRFLLLSALLALVAALAISFLLNNLTRPDNILGGFLFQNPPILTISSITTTSGFHVLLWVSLELMFRQLAPSVQYRPFRPQELIIPALVALFIVGYFVVGMLVTRTPQEKK